MMLGMLMHHMVQSICTVPVCTLDASLRAAVKDRQVRYTHDIAVQTRPQGPDTMLYPQLHYWQTCLGLSNKGLKSPLDLQHDVDRKPHPVYRLKVPASRLVLESNAALEAIVTLIHKHSLHRPQH